MFRQLLMFPSSVDLEAAERIVRDEIAPFYRQSDGFVSLSTSVGPLMGPAAREGGAGVIVEAVFETLDASLTAIMAPAFEPTKSTVESLGVEIYLFETNEL